MQFLAPHTPRPELVSLGIAGADALERLPLEIIGVRRSGVTVTVPQGSATCTPWSTGALLGGCDALQLAPGLTATDMAANAAVTVAAEGATATMPIEVWAPLDYRIEPEEFDLRRIEGFWDANCTAQRFAAGPKPSVRVRLNSTRGGELDVEVASRALTAGALVVADGKVATLRDNGAIEALAQGNTSLRLEGVDGRTLAAAAVRVHDEATARVLALDAIALGAMTAAVAPGTGGDGVGSVVLDIAPVLDREGATAAVVAVALLDDGTRVELAPADGLMLTSETPGVSVADGTAVVELGAGNASDGRVLAEWLAPEACAHLRERPLAAGYASFQVALPTPQRIELTLDEDEVATTAAVAAIASLPTAAAVTATLVYASGRRVDVTDDPRAQFELTSGDALVALQPGANGLELTTTGATAGLASLRVEFSIAGSTFEAEVQLNVVEVTELNATTAPVPAAVLGSPASAAARVRRVAGTVPATFQRVAVGVQATLSNGATIDVSTDPSLSLTSTLLEPEGGPAADAVRLESAAGRHQLTVAAGTATWAQNVTARITVASTTLGLGAECDVTLDPGSAAVASIDGLKAVRADAPGSPAALSTLSGIRGATAQLALGVTLEDGTRCAAAA